MAVMVNNAGVPSWKQINVTGPIILVGAGVAAAAGFGALLGAMGAAFDPLVLGALLMGAGTAIGAGVWASDRPWQLDLETPSKWLEYHDWRTVAFNGLTLGLGFASRIGYWAWYLLPIGALASRDPTIGAAIFGTYAAVRLGLSVFGVARLKPGRLSSLRIRIAPILDPLTLLYLGLVVATVWSRRSSI